MSEMKIEVVRLYKTSGEGAIKAFVDVQFGDSFIVKGFKIIQGKQDLFVAMPSELSKKEGETGGKWFNTFVPLNDDFKNELSDIIMESYEA